MGCPKGVKSNLKRMEWEEQIAAICMYLKHGYYPDSILENNKCNKKKKNEKGLLQDNREL